MLQTEFAFKGIQKQDKDLNNKIKTVGTLIEKIKAIPHMPKEAINSQEIQVRMQNLADEIKMIPKIDPPPIIPNVINP